MTKIVKIGNLTIGDGSPVFVGGPCMAESFDICARTAEFLLKLCAENQVQYIFKASYDKANRTSHTTVRGPGMEKGLEILARIKKEFDLPVLTDIHSPEEAKIAAEIGDVLQIPAFLCRQTDLLLAAGQTGRVVNVKKGQFMAPEDMAGAVEKIRSTGNNNILLTERGSSFGYHNLVVDMRSLPIMRGLGVPVVFDATHSVQIPGGNGTSSGGQREFVETLALAAAAAGIDALFCEVHPEPDKALSDGANSLDFALARQILAKVTKIHRATKES